MHVRAEKESPPLGERSPQAALAADAGLDLSGLTWIGFAIGNLLPVTLGNIIGGVLVGGLFWACWLRKGRGA